MAAWTGGGRIDSTADIRAALQRVNATAETRGTTALLARAVQTADQVELTQPDLTQVLPCDPQLQPLLPWPGGIRRGATLTATGSASLLMLLLAGAMHDTGSWAAIVGLPDFGFLAAVQEFGIPSDRLAAVPAPGPDWPAVVASLLDGLDMVVVQPPPGTSDPMLRQLQARARQKRCVLVTTRPYAGADLTLQATGQRWHGLGDGRGRLRWRELDVQAAGRGRAGQPKTATIRLHYRPPLSIPARTAFDDASSAANTASSDGGTGSNNLKTFAR